MISPCCLCIPLLFFFFCLYASHVASKKCKQFILPRTFCLVFILAQTSHVHRFACIFNDFFAECHQSSLLQFRDLDFRVWGMFLP
jgi:hypothetical protein